MTPSTSLKHCVAHCLAIAALMVSVQASALTAQQTQHGCDHDVGDCTTGNTNPFGGSADSPASYQGTFNFANGDVMEMYDDDQGGFEITTSKDGKVKVAFGGKSAMLIKPAPPKSEMKRSKLAYGALTPSLTSAEAIAKEKAAIANAAKAAAAKAAADKASADAAKAAADKLAADKAAAVYTGPALGAQPAGGGVVLASRKKP